MNEPEDDRSRLPEIARDDRNVLLLTAVICVAPFALSALCRVAYFAINVVIGLVVLAAAIAVQLYDG